MKTRILTVLTLTALLLGACKKDNKTDDAAASASGTGGGSSYADLLLIDQFPITLNAGQDFQVSSSYMDDNLAFRSIDNNNLTYSSRDNNVFTVTANGLITAVASGYTYIDVVDAEGQATFTGVEVRGVNKFTVSPNIVDAYVGTTHQLTPYDRKNSSATYTYTSISPSIASVNSSGLVTLNAEGLATIEVTSSAFTNSNKFIVHIVAKKVPVIVPVVEKIKIHDPQFYDPNDPDFIIPTFLLKQYTASLVAKAYDKDDAEIQTTFNWSSDNPSIASVNSSGVVTGVAEGVASIRATSSGISSTFDVYVLPDTIVEITPDDVTLAKGQTQQFTAKAYNQRTNTLLPSITNFNWSVDFGNNIGTISSTGLLTVGSNAQDFDNILISANANGLSSFSEGYAGITIDNSSIPNCGAGNPNVNSIIIQDGSSLTLSFGPPHALTVDALDNVGSPVANPALVYHSSNTGVIDIDPFTNELIALGNGTATITVCSGSFASATISVTVQ